MKKVFFLFCLILFSVSLFAESEEDEQIPGFMFVIGPRIGVSYYIDSSEEFSTMLSDYFPGEYFPVYTLFGLSLEQRILLGKTKSHFAFQEIILVGGLEQSIAIPIGAILIGFRSHSGFEFGFGPIGSFSGFGVVCAVGWTFSYREVYVPVDLHVILPNKERPPVVGLTFGFNFRTKIFDTN